MEKENLLNMPVDELVEKVLKLEKELDRENTNSSYWLKCYSEVKEQFDRYKAAVKNVVLLID